MKIIHCPLNGPRNAQEFAFGGEVCEEPHADASTQEWADHVFYEDNRRGVVDEWWCHIASAYWFIVRRNRSSDEIVATFTPSEYFQGQGQRPA